jgi:hypothetical protein
MHHCAGQHIPCCLGLTISGWYSQTVQLMIVWTHKNINTRTVIYIEYGYSLIWVRLLIRIRTRIRLVVVGIPVYILLLYPAWIIWILHAERCVCVYAPARRSQTYTPSTSFWQYYVCCFVVCGILVYFTWCFVSFCVVFIIFHLFYFFHPKFLFCVVFYFILHGVLFYVTRYYIYNFLLFFLKHGILFITEPVMIF